ncbi:hypothetical protein [Paramicrobacterium agarici]|uniref:Uncharacterized protein n=1 Tax=Paramicrobacterium agarici TaxID=630514 RepID=A0A2A9DUI3_9MICO|nr:hypothetical protein [Microbacterium agarici]PFG30244.1 hypothetical protein ATJ78_1169 [Microbacterium agarici]TQO23251.1 hypothetical protein FB385_2098 [Microbacterium agarici]
MSVTFGEPNVRSRRSPFSEVREATRQRVLLGIATGVGATCIPLVVGGAVAAAYYL